MAKSHSVPSYKDCIPRNLREKLSKWELMKHVNLDDRGKEYARKKKEGQKHLKEQIQTDISIEDATINMAESSDYHGQFIWSREFNVILFKPDVRYLPHKVSIRKALSSPVPQFAEYVDPFHILNFRNRFRNIDYKHLDIPEILSLADIKDIVMYTILTDLPRDFISLFMTKTVDCLLRSLLVYFQYYIQVWKIMKQRKEIRKSKLLHPNSVNFQSKWKNNLNDLRYMVSKYYLKILMGRDDTKIFHHMYGSEVSHSYKDLKLYELLYLLSSRIITETLNEKGNKVIIQNEMNRLFRVIKEEDNLLKKLGANERDVLEAKFPFPRGWYTDNPLISEGLRQGRDPIFEGLGKKYMQIKNKRLRLLQAAYLMPESNLKKANIKLGILGDPMEDHPPLLSCKEIKSRRRCSPLRKEDILKKLKPKNFEVEQLVTKHDLDKPYNLIYWPLPKSFNEDSRSAQLKRILAFRQGRISGLASKWDYEEKRWKK